MSSDLERICSICLSYMLNDKLQGWLRCLSCGFMKKESKSMITLEEVLMNRAKFEDLPEEIKKNGEDLLVKLNKFRTEYGKPMIVVSGYRPPDINAAAGGATHSAHMTLEACDFKDEDGSIFEFIKKDPTVLDRCDLFIEDPRWTKNWIHIQNRKVSQRVFLPYSDGRPPTAPERKI